MLAGLDAADAARPDRGDPVDEDDQRTEGDTGVACADLRDPGSEPRSRDAPPPEAAESPLAKAADADADAELLAHDRHSRLIEITLALAGVALMIGVGVLVPEIRHGVSLALHGNLHGMRQEFRGLGFGGVMLLVGLVVSHAIVFFPSEIINATAGFVYGFVPGLALVMGAWVISSLVAYMLGRTLARPLLQRIFGVRRFNRAQRAVEEGGVPLLLASRLIPVVPSALMSYVAGAAHVPVVRFVWTTVIGTLPITAAVTLLGSRAQTLSFSDPVVWGTIVLMIALLAAVRLVDFDRAKAAR
jgi:uncharacterized membrane protein YdjX (TVP38/TMEM64 family)